MIRVWLSNKTDFQAAGPVFSILSTVPDIPVGTQNTTMSGEGSGMARLCFRKYTLLARHVEDKLGYGSFS